MRRVIVPGLVALAVAGFACAASAQDAWVASWGASPVFAVGPEVNNQTIRQVVRLSAGGKRVRLRISNETSPNPLVIGAAHLAMPGNAPGSIDPATDHALTFGGAPSVTVPAGAPAYSDPIDLDVAPLSSLAVSLFVSRWTGPSVIHFDGVATAYLSGDGDVSGAAEIPQAKTSLSRFFITEVDVADPEKEGATLVTLGDSITDGYRSAIDGNHRWPDRLAERLGQRPNAQPVGVVNAGVSGNRILHDRPEDMFGPSALARLDRDVLSTPGLRWVVLMEGINDIGHATSAGLAEQDVSAEQIIAGMQQIIARVHGRGAKIYGATLTPYEGTVFHGYYTTEGEAKRQAVNRWIRTGAAFDAVIDFDATLRDPAHPSRIRAEYDVGDHLHPNDSGYKAMGDAVDPDLFQ